MSQLPKRPKPWLRGADAIIAHVGTNGGRLHRKKGAVLHPRHGRRATDAGNHQARWEGPQRHFLSHGGPICAPEDAGYINQHTDCVGFVGASSLERLAVEKSLTDLTRAFKTIPVRDAARKPFKKR